MVAGLAREDVRNQEESQEEDRGQRLRRGSPRRRRPRFEPRGADEESEDVARQEEGRAAPAEHAKGEDDARRQRAQGQARQPHAGEAGMGGQGYDPHHADHVEPDRRVRKRERLHSIRRAGEQPAKDEPGDRTSGAPQLPGGPGGHGRRGQRPDPQGQERRDPAQGAVTDQEQARPARIVDVARHQTAADEQRPHGHRPPELPRPQVIVRGGARQETLEAEAKLGAVRGVEADLLGAAVFVQEARGGHGQVLPVAARGGQPAEVGAGSPVRRVPQQQRRGQDTGEQGARRREPAQLTPPCGPGRRDRGRLPPLAAGRAHRGPRPRRSRARTARGS